MRRVVVAIALAAVVGGAAWALWPTTTWPQSFCAPDLRIVGADATAIMTNEAHNGYQHAVIATPGAQVVVATMRADIVHAKSNAPTSQLRTELGVYLSHLGNADSMLTVTNALSQFDQEVHTQLKACGLRPVGSRDAARSRAKARIWKYRLRETSLERLAYA